MRTLSVRGIEILDDPSVPDGEIWLHCPMQSGVKVRYMFNLLDYRMTQPGDESFFMQLKQWLLDLESDLQGVNNLDLTLGRVGLILEAMNDFQSGKDPRTVPENDA